jgi:lipoprotein signal peptidase
MRRSFARSFGAISAATAVIVADQIAKATIAHADTGTFTPAHNPGLITGWSPVSMSTVIVLTVAVIVGFLAIVGRWAVQIGISPVIPALIGGGMTAHLVDRVRFGGVRDFLPTGVLIVDVADLAVILGVVLLAASYGRRVWTLRKAGKFITLELPSLRASIVDRSV